MRKNRHLIVCLVPTILVLFSAAATAAETMVIVGSTIINVSNFGNGAADIEDAVVVIEGDLIVAER